MIRSAKLTDLPALVELGRQLCAESPRWGRLTYDAEKAGETISELIENVDGFVWVAERDGVIVGALLAVIDEHWASRDRLVQELSLFVRPDARGAMHAARLICVLDAWAEGKGAKWTQVGISTGVAVERTAELYERLGFVRCVVGLERAYGC